MFDSQFCSEIFRPWNSPCVNSLFSATSTYVVLGIFTFVGFPLFYLNLRLVDNFIEHNYDKATFKASVKQKLKRKHAK